MFVGLFVNMGECKLTRILATRTVILHRSQRASLTELSKIPKHGFVGLVVMGSKVWWTLRGIGLKVDLVQLGYP